MIDDHLQQAHVPVPFVDLAPTHAGTKASILEAIADLIQTGAFVNGPPVERFERAFAAYCGSQSCVGLASGTDALKLALLGAGIEPGDEVIVPAMTFVATLEAVSQTGGLPVVVDVDELDYTMDVAAAEAAVTPRTRFLLPVHLYGQMADMRALSELARPSALGIVEDACQAHGASRDGWRAGAAGRAGAFSFYPSKNLGALGDAGALVTDDPELAARVRALREHGQTVKNRHDIDGYTARLDTIQALALLEKLPMLDGWNEERCRAAAFYAQALEGGGDLRLPSVPEGSKPVWHVYVVRTRHAEGLAHFLAERQIGTGRHYPQCPHLAPAYAWLNHRQGDFPVAESLASASLSLPMFAGISQEQLEAVASAVEAYFERG